MHDTPIHKTSTSLPLTQVRGLYLEDTFGDGEADEEIDMEVGSQHILKYSAAGDHIKKGDLRLI